MQSTAPGVLSLCGTVQILFLAATIPRLVPTKETEEKEDDCSLGTSSEPDGSVGGGDLAYWPVVMAGGLAEPRTPNMMLQPLPPFVRLSSTPTRPKADSWDILVGTKLDIQNPGLH